MTVSERFPFSGLLLPLQEGYTYSCDRRTTDGMELLFIRIFAVKGGRPAVLRRQGENMKKNIGKIKVLK